VYVYVYVYVCVEARVRVRKKKKLQISWSKKKKQKSDLIKGAARKKNWRGSRTTCERSNEQTRDSESEIKRRKMGIWHIAFSTATTNEDERAAAATREKREKKHFKWIKYTLTLCFCLSRAARPRVIVCVCDIVSAEKKNGKLPRFSSVCVIFLPPTCLLFVRYPSSDSVNSLSVYFSCNSLQQSELCFYYYCVSVGFALCDIPFFFFFFSCF